MKTVFFILVLIHGLIHSLGFVKAFGLKEVKQLTTYISKPMGFVWLIAGCLFIAYGLVYFAESKLAWLIGGIALIISQFVVVYYWSDAKYATVVNLIVLVSVVMNYRASSFQSKIQNEVASILSASTQNSGELSQREIESLPTCVQNWLVQSGAIQEGSTYNGFIQQKARMKMKPDQKEWYEAAAWQYTTIAQPAFVWSVALDMNPVMKVKGRDRFVNGKGEMLISMNSLFNIVNAKGFKIDEGSLQRFLGELVWFPSLALSPYVKWEEISENTAKATMSYQGTTGSGTFYFNEKGDFTKFVALRFQGNEPEAERKNWILTVDEYATFENIRVPSKMKATWALESGDWTWLELEILQIHYNIASPFKHSDLTD